jgi:hypothetical protein
MAITSAYRHRLFDSGLPEQCPLLYRGIRQEQSYFISLFLPRLRRRWQMTYPSSMLSGGDSPVNVESLAEGGWDPDFSVFAVGTRRLLARTWAATVAATLGRALRAMAALAGNYIGGETMTGSAGTASTGSMLMTRPPFSPGATVTTSFGVVSITEVPLSS